VPLFDTNYLIDLTSGDESAISLAEQVDRTSDIKAVSVVTVHEYLRGVFYHHLDKEIRDEKMRKALADLAHFEQLDFTSAVAREAALLDAVLYRKGTMIPYPDVVIAATASHHNLHLVTRDTHFLSIEGLTVIEY
jgi:predicted nucleic acid-binding protein